MRATPRNIGRSRAGGEAYRVGAANGTKRGLRHYTSRGPGRVARLEIRRGGAPWQKERIAIPHGVRDKEIR